MAKKFQYSFGAFLRDLHRFIHPYRWQFWPAVGLRLTSDIAKLYSVWALSQIVNQLVLPEPNISLITTYLVLWPVVTTFEAIAHAGSKNIGNFIAEKAGIDAFFATLSHIYTLDLDWQEKENSGNKLKRANRGRDGINRVIRHFFNVMIESSVNTIGIVLIFLNLDLTISMSFIFYIITFYGIGTWLTLRASKQEYQVNKIDENVEGLSFESINNIRTIKSLSIEKRITNSVITVTNQLKQAIQKRVWLFQSRNGILIWYYYLFEVGLISFIVWGIINGRYEVSMLILFHGYLQRVVESSWEMAETTQQVIVGKIWVGRMMQILNTEPIIEHPELKQKEYPTNWQKLSIKNVHFDYEGQPALTDISLEIKRGEKIGIVGLSGAGKSTLFKLLMDLHEDYQGDISLDDVSLKNIWRRNYINHVAVVLQDTELFNTSLKNNIELAKTSQTKMPLEQAISIAYLDELVERLPKGLDTVVGEKGVKLSGGERQRVGIARALYRQPDILLMDEATSHLDVHSEKKIQQALHTFFEQVTAIVIAHRLSTIKEMDRIVVLQNGTIKEQGTFETLSKKKNGIFAKMWREQKLS